MSLRFVWSRVCVFLYIVLAPGVVSPELWFHQRRRRRGGHAPWRASARVVSTTFGASAGNAQRFQLPATAPHPYSKAPKGATPRHHHHHLPFPSDSFIYYHAELCHSPHSCMVAFACDLQFIFLCLLQCQLNNAANTPVVVLPPFYPPSHVCFCHKTLYTLSSRYFTRVALFG